LSAPASQPPGVGGAGVVASSSVPESRTTAAAPAAGAAPSAAIAPSAPSAAGAAPAAAAPAAAPSASPAAGAAPAGGQAAAAAGGAGANRPLVLCPVCQEGRSAWMVLKNCRHLGPCLSCLPDDNGRKGIVIKPRQYHSCVVCNAEVQQIMRIFSH
jgi:hypothetical protein